MNLYIFNETRRGTVFGVGTYIRELTSALDDTDIHIYVVNMLSDKPQIQMEELEGVGYWYFPTPIEEPRTSDSKKQRELYFCSVVYLLQLHIKDKNNLIFHLNYHQSESLVDELKRVFDCKVVSVAHFSDWGFTLFDNLPRLREILNEEHPDTSGENVKKMFDEEKSYYTKVDHIICLSNYMREILHWDYELNLERISVIPNGLIDMNNTSTGNKFLRNKWHIKAGEKIVLFAGRVDKVKGLNYLISAFREVLKINQDCRLLIAGSGNYDPFFLEAKDICAKVTFTGLLEKNELYELYQIADVGVTPSLFEPFGYVPVEMMMHGLPIVATETSGLNEVVDESCGLKIPLTVLPDSVEIDTSLLAQKIVFLLQNPMEANRLGKNGRKRYLEKYSSRVFGENMKAFYKSLI